MLGLLRKWFTRGSEDEPIDTESNPPVEPAEEPWPVSIVFCTCLYCPRCDILGGACVSLMRPCTKCRSTYQPYTDWGENGHFCRSRLYSFNSGYVPFQQQTSLSPETRAFMERDLASRPGAAAQMLQYGTWLPPGSSPPAYAEQDPTVEQDCIAEQGLTAEQQGGDAGQDILVKQDGIVDKGRIAEQAHTAEQDHTVTAEQDPIAEPGRVAAVTHRLQYNHPDAKCWASLYCSTCGPSAHHKRTSEVAVRRPVEKPPRPMIVEVEDPRVMYCVVM